MPYCSMCQQAPAKPSGYIACQDKRYKSCQIPGSEPVYVDQSNSYAYINKPQLQPNMQFFTLVAAIFAAAVVASPAPKAAMITRTTSIENGVAVERSELGGEVCCWVGNQVGTRAFGTRSQSDMVSVVLRVQLVGSIKFGRATYGMVEFMGGYRDVQSVLQAVSDHIACRVGNRHDPLRCAAPSGPLYFSLPSSRNFCSHGS